MVWKLSWSPTLSLDVIFQVFPEHHPSLHENRPLPGKPAEDLAKAKPNPMINGHQEWLDGLVVAARLSPSL
ncbi:hypothetical protein [Pseudomonas fluorescens]|jgi:hypothetical protein|uniref:hypothetical protein n=1 Tax=Pseudomonas fluorescens TaxID=294 RepID=UPI0007D04D11